MKFGRKIPAAVAVIGLAAGLTLVGPVSSSGAQGQIQMGCVGVPGSEAETLILAVPDLFPGGIVPIPVTIGADVPADLAPGASAPVSFSWVLDPGDELSNVATAVGSIETIEAELLEVSISQSGGTGGPYAFTPTATLNFVPESFPTVTASGNVTAGDAPIAYAFDVGRLDLTISGSKGNAQLLELDCFIEGNNVVGGTAVGGVAPPTPGGDTDGGSSGGGGNVSTTIGRGTTGSANARVTG